MPQQFAAEFQQLPDQSPEHDLMARLYREIGLSAVAAALEIMDMAPISGAKATPADPHQAPAFLMDGSLAA